MKINQEMRRVEVFYDGDCGMCRTLIAWLKKQKLYLPAECMPYQSEDATRRFPELMQYEPWKHVVTRGDTGEIFVGGETSVLLLWITRRNRWLGVVLKTWPIFPLVKLAYRIAAPNRQLLSRLFFRKESALCNNGSCGLRKE